jgi:hypothetical protein
LHVISNVAILINASDNEPAARSAAVLLGEECEVKLVLAHLHALDIGVAVNAGHLEASELPVLERTQHVVVESEVRDVAQAVRVLLQDRLHYTWSKIVCVHSFSYVGLHRLG